MVSVGVVSVSGVLFIFILTTTTTSTTISTTTTSTTTTTTGETYKKLGRKAIVPFVL